MDGGWVAAPSTEGPKQLPNVTGFADTVTPVPSLVHMHEL